MSTASRKERPYRPSWIDRFNDWVEELPIPAWFFYADLGLVLILCQMLFLWLDGGLQAEELLPIIIYNGLLTAFALALIHILDRQAVTALNAMRPTLEMTEAEFDESQYRLSNMPFLAPLIAGMILLVVVILMEQVSTLPNRYAALEQLPVFSIVYHIVDKSSAFLLGVIIYHTVRQLGRVNAINLNHVRVNLFNLGPLQAFSKLTASTAVGLVIGVYGWMLINPELLADPVSLAFVGAFTVMAVAVFVWPLLGTHRRMEVEKAELLQELDLYFEAAFAKLYQRLRDDDDSAIEKLNGTISSLEIQHRRISAIPTWPWRPETARLALSAIALPMILTILQLLAQQALGW
ncbi:MAG: hypothetical protein PVI80_16705 [Anaerolineae bacterium]